MYSRWSCWLRGRRLSWWCSWRGCWYWSWHWSRHRRRNWSWRCCRRHCVAFSSITVVAPSTCTLLKSVGSNATLFRRIKSGREYWVIIGTPFAVEVPHTAFTSSGFRSCSCGGRSRGRGRRCSWFGRGTRRKDERALTTAKNALAALFFIAITCCAGPNSSTLYAGTR